MRLYCGDGGYKEKELFYRKSSTEELIEIAKDGNFVDDVPVVLSLLYAKDPENAIELAKSIIEEEKGDRVMRETIMDFLKNKDKKWWRWQIKKSAQGL